VARFLSKQLAGAVSDYHRRLWPTWDPCQKFHPFSALIRGWLLQTRLGAARRSGGGWQKG
jgi:hypothetical protein